MSSKQSAADLGHRLHWLTMTCEECGLWANEIFTRQKPCSAVDDGGAANEPEPSEDEAARNARIWDAVQAAGRA